MLAVLFGSYSMATTFAGMPSFAFLLKSMILSFLLLPPPLCLTVILPCALRPALFFLETTRDFSGVLFVISAKSEPVMCLLDGVYAVYFLIPIFFLLTGANCSAVLCYHGKDSPYSCALLFTDPGRSRSPWSPRSAGQWPFSASRSCRRSCLCAWSWSGGSWC